MAAAQKQQEKEPVNIIHQNAIFCETIMKEQRHQKLYTSFGFNPYKKRKNRARMQVNLFPMPIDSRSVLYNPCYALSFHPCA